MKKAIWLACLVVCTGCVTVKVPKYLQDEFPYQKKFYASFDDTLAATKNALQVLYLFEMRLSDILGFRPNFHRCFNCGRPMDAKTVGPKGVELYLNGGGVFCVNCLHKALGQGTISLGALKVLQRLQEIQEIGAVTRLALSMQVRNEVAGTLRRFLQSHIEGLHKLKAEEVFAAIT